MQLSELRIRLQDYGPFEGKYIGTAEFKGQHGSIHINLSTELSPKILKVCADMIVNQAHETAGLLTAQVIEQIDKTKQIT